MLLAAPGKLELWLARTYKMRGLSTWKPQSCSDTKNKHPHTLILLWLCSDVPKINFAVYYIFFHVYMAQGPCTRTQQYRLIEVERKNIYQRKKIQLTAILFSSVIPNESIRKTAARPGGLHWTDRITSYLVSITFSVCTILRDADIKQQ